MRTGSGSRVGHGSARSYERSDWSSSSPKPRSTSRAGRGGVVWPWTIRSLPLRESVVPIRKHADRRGWREGLHHAAAEVKYRPEVDGLRALAVLPVIFFHAGFPGFAGGYLGVDVFFV